MSAEVETMMFTGRERPWHGLGTQVEEAPDSREALIAAGLDWDVVQKPVFTQDGVKVPGYFANVRQQDGSILGVVTSRYKVVQNRDAFGFTDALLGDGVRYETAGSLMGGRKTWILAKLPTRYIIQGEQILPYLVFSNTHDGSGAIKIAMTPIRVVCNNTLNLALDTADRSWSIHHTGDIAAKLEDARETLFMAEDYMNELGKGFEDLSRKRLTDAAVDEFIKELLPIADDASETTEKNILRLRKDVATRYFDAPDLQGLRKKDLLQCKLQTKKIKKDIKMIDDKINEIDNYLSVDIDESSLNKIYKKIKEIEKEVIDCEVEMDSLQAERVAQHGVSMTAQTLFSRKAESVLTNLETIDSDERTVKYTHMAIDIIREYKYRLQKRKTAVLAETMTKCYKKLANKKNLVDKIEMDTETLDLIYLNKQKEEVAKQRLSAGEKQLMVISLLWALAICSKKKLPVIIDTPLSRLDSSHRTALIKTYFPKASDQTIILSTDSEIDEKYYKMMKPSIGDEFTLEYSDVDKKTSIRTGYFDWGGKKK